MPPAILFAMFKTQIGIHSDQNADQQWHGSLREATRGPEASKSRDCIKEEQSCYLSRKGSVEHRVWLQGAPRCPTAHAGSPGAPVSQNLHGLKPQPQPQPQQPSEGVRNGGITSHVSFQAESRVHFDISVWEGGYSSRPVA